MDINMLNFIYCAVFAVIGICIFSFLNVVIYRFPRHIFWENSRSFCPACRKQLKWYDLVPVLSWIFLGGKCRYCRSRISVRYPLVEIAGGISAIMCLYYFGNWNDYWYEISDQAVLVFVWLGLLLVIALIDYDTMEIANGLVISCMIPAAAAILIFPEVMIWERLIGLICVSVPLLVITLLVPGAFGGGDIKLMAVIGFGIGWKLCLAAFLLAILTGGCYGIYVLAAKKMTRKEHFAFGPFLCLGTVMAIFWGEQLIDWYLNFLIF